MLCEPSQLTSKDFDFIPVKPLGHRKKILQEVGKLANRRTRRGRQHWSQVKPLAHQSSLAPRKLHTDTNLKNQRTLADGSYDEERQR